MAEISDEMYEELRQILERKNSKSYTLEDAREIGNELIAFYSLLMEFEKENPADE